MQNIESTIVELGSIFSAAGAHGQRAGRDGSEVRQPHKHKHTTGITFCKTTDSTVQYMLHIHAVQTTQHLVTVVFIYCLNQHKCQCEFYLDLRLKVDVWKYSLSVSCEHQDRRQCGGHQLNVEMAHTEILKYFQSVSSIAAHDQDIPRSHHLLHHLCGLPRLRRNDPECKEGWKRSQRFWRSEEQAMDLWANVQKHKWTVPQGTLAPGGGFGGVLMLSGGMIFVRVTWVRC